MEYTTLYAQTAEKFQPDYTPNEMWAAFRWYGVHLKIVGYKLKLSRFSSKIGRVCFLPEKQGVL
jgi:hypothetical protein